MIFEETLSVSEVIIRIIRRNHFVDLQYILLVSNCHNIDINHLISMEL